MIFVLAPEFTSIVLGEKWLPIVPILRILSASGLLISIGATAGPLLQGVGRPDIVTKILALRLAITALLIYPLTKSWGMAGTALTVLICLVVVEPIEIYMAAKLSGNGLKAICKTLFVPFANSVMILALVFYFKGVFVSHYGILGLFFLGIISVVSYFLLTYCSDKLVSYPALTIMRKAFFKGIYGTGT
jgi:O-antigen/teichoic acid export membrane protein